MSTRRIHVGNIGLNVADEGDGPAVVLIHGLGWSHALWERQRRRLSDRYRVIAPDTRGHGGSDVPQGPYSISQYCDDLIALLDALQLEKVALVGFSQGCMTAQLALTRHPARFSAAVLACAPCRDHPTGRQNMEMRIAAMERDGPQAAAEIALTSIFSPSFLKANPQAAEAFLASRLQVDPVGLISAMRAAYGFDVTAGLPGVVTPALVIAGEQDSLAPPAAVAEVAAAIRGAEFHVVEGAGHMVPIEAPEAFDGLVEPFLDLHAVR